MSADDARRTLAEFEQTRFVPPPRRIDDLLVLLDTAPPASEQWGALIEQADRPIPERATVHGRIVALLARAQAARTIGRSGQELTDLRTAVELVESSGQSMEFPLGPPTAERLYADLAWAELYDGNYQSAIARFQRSLHQRVPESGGTTGPLRWPTLAGLAYAHASVGELEQARRVAKDLDVSIHDAGRHVGIWFGHQANNPWRRIYAATIRATLLEAEGRWAEAEPALRESIAIFEREVDRAGPYLHSRTDDWIDLRYAQLAGNLLRQDRLVDAELVIRAALGMAVRSRGATSKSVAILAGLMSELLLAQGRFGEAAEVAARTIGIYQDLLVPAGSRELGLVRLRLAAARVSQGEWTEAGAEYDLIRTSYPTLADFQRLYAADTTMLLTLLKLDRAREAADLARFAHERESRNRGTGHYDEVELRAILALAQLRSEAPSEGIARFHQAVDRLIDLDQRVRTVSGSRPDRRLRLRVLVEAYLETLVGAGSDGAPSAARIARAFEVAAFAQGRSVEAALLSSAARSSVRDPELSQVGRRVQDASLRLEGLLTLLGNALSQPQGTQSTAVVEELRRDIERLRVSIDVSGRDLARRFPAYAGLVNPGLATSAALSEALADDESFILIFGGETRTWIWALRRRRPVVFSSVPLSSTEIQRMVAALRRGLSLESGEVGDIPPFDVALAHQVYQSVLAPVASEWGAARRLIVAADGPLATVPLSMLSTRPGHALVDRDVLFDRYREVAWLARDYAVSSVPSASAFLALRRSSAVSAARKAFAGFGDPRFGRIAPRSPDEQGGDRSAHGARATRVSARASPRGILVTSVQHRGLPSLPETADEVRAIARALGANLEADVFLGVDASETRVKTMALDDRRLIVFATHGLVAGDFDGLTEPGLALSSPELTGESGEDGVLTMSEILGVKLNAEWVVLSACNTAAPDGSGAEAISGLGRAFLYAGARALLVTHWPVETTSARALTTTLFRLWSGTPAPAQAEALRRAMMVLVDEQGYRDTMGRMVFSYAHPVFWAPFAMIGDGGRGGVPRVAERIASAE